VTRTPLLLLALAASCGLEEADRRDYDRLLFERGPADRPREAAGEDHARLAARGELGLGDCARMAAWRSESLALEGEELARVRLRVRQAFGAALPYASFRGSYTRQDTVSGTSGVQSNFTLRDRTQYQFTLHQDLFRGLETYHEIRRQSSLAGAREDALRQAKLLLQADVAGAFYAVLALERELATLVDALRLSEERLEELAVRARAGITRRSEVLTQEADVARTRADRERLRGLLAAAWEALRFLTGLPSERRLVDDHPQPDALPPLDDHVRLALASRPDLRRARAEIDAAGEGVGAARSAVLPLVALDANYYTHREGISKDVDWDLVLSFEQPIFEGGVAQARIREARSEVRSAELRERALRREIALSVARLWQDARSFDGELSALASGFAAASENYELAQAEYRRGIAANLEVLTAFTQMQRTKLDLDRTRFRAKLARVRLDLECGTPLPGGAP
jgi:outer membrane protein TolC